MRNVITKTCPYCRGSGEVALNGVYADTLVALRKQPSEVTGAELARVLGTGGPAMNNRLAALEHMGLAVSRRYGRKRLYKVV